MRGITNMFRNSRIRIAYKTTNTTFEMLTHSKQCTTVTSGIYKLTCNTCQGVYRILDTRSTSDTFVLITLNRLLLCIFLTIEMNTAHRNV